MNEEAIVTTTNNAGAGLDSPKLPIKPNVFRRVIELIKKNKKNK